MPLKSSSRETADNNLIPLQLITFILSDEPRMQRFVALSGLDPSNLKNDVTKPEFQGFLLDYALQDESLLLAFCAHLEIKPETVYSLRRKLPGAEL